MPGMGRVGDVDSANNTKTTGSENVFINGAKALAVSLSIDSKNHVCTTGSSTVFINGQPAVRLGDEDSSNNVLKTASENVIGG